MSLCILRLGKGAEVDTALYRQMADRSAQEPELQLRDIRSHAVQDVEARLPHSLFDAQGQHMAGAIQQLPAISVYDKPQEFDWLKPNGRQRPIRFIAHHLPDSKILLVAQYIHDIRGFDELLIRVLVSGGLPSPVKGVGPPGRTRWRSLIWP